jgi:glycosyltransferase involved in cell wall biosynthesis
VGLHWKSSGGPRRARLEQPVGTPVSFDLGPVGGRLRLEGRVAIASGGLGRARIRVRVDAIRGDGRGTKLWAGALRRSGERRRPAERLLEARFEAPRGTRLVLSASGPGRDRVVWEELAIRLADDPGGEPPGAGPPRSEAGAPASAAAPRGDVPRFSILTPVHDPPPAVLQQTIASVLEQSFADWELCLFDDGSADPRVIDVLRRAASDPRVRLERGEQAGGISVATNAALKMATGEYIALLDHDDLLFPDALEQVDAGLREQPGTDMAYSDEEVFEEGAETSHTFAKPNWSPDLLRSQMYTCHLGVYRRSLAEDVGGFRPELDGSQDFDFVLRVTERTERVLHIPRVLYRWRAHAGSTAGDSGAKPSAYPAGRLAIARHLERTGVEADVHFGPWDGIYRVVHRPRAGLEIAVGLTGRDEEAGSALVEALEVEAARDRNSVRVERRGSLAEAGAACAGADVVVLCEGDVEPLTRLWLRRLVGFALQPRVAAVGATTLAPDGRVEQGGIAIDDGLPVPLMFAAGAGDPGPLGVGVLPANVAAVSGVVAFGGESFQTLGGLDPDLGGLAVPDLCLRAIAASRRVVTAPDVLLRRTDGRGFVNELGALAEFRRRWSGAFPRDPYFDLESCWPGVEIR